MQQTIQLAGQALALGLFHKGVRVLQANTLWVEQCFSHLLQPNLRLLLGCESSEDLEEEGLLGIDFPTSPRQADEVTGDGSQHSVQLLSPSLGVLDGVQVAFTGQADWVEADAFAVRRARC